MNRAWKWLFSLNFETGFWSSFLKLLVIWNPLWSFVLSLIYAGGIIRDMTFRWAWSLSEATLVGVFAMFVIGLFRWGEYFWSKLFKKKRAVHGTGWYLFFMAVLVPPGLVLALRLIISLINLVFVGDPISPDFHWQYYSSETFWGWMLLLVFFLLKSWEEIRDTARLNQIRAEELEKERLQALLTKLKDQMNPHFLFNTLNTVASLIPEDPPKAERIVVKLSALFQAVLEASRRTNHPLKKELEFCRDYLEIEKARFGDRLRPKVKVEPGVDVEKLLVPVLILQPLVENAVKHGISSRAEGGQVWVSAGVSNGYLTLSVEDDGVGFGNSPYAGSGTALENCRKRMELEFGTEGSFVIGPGRHGGTKIDLSMAVQRIMALRERGEA